MTSNRGRREGDRLTTVPPTHHEWAVTRAHLDTNGYGLILGRGSLRKQPFLLTPCGWGGGGGNGCFRRLREGATYFFFPYVPFLWASSLTHLQALYTLRVPYDAGENKTV